MNEDAYFDEMIHLLYEQITGQSKHKDSLAPEDATRECQSAIESLDNARSAIASLLRFANQDKALEHLSECCAHMAEVMFEQGYRLGYRQYLLPPEKERTHLMIVVGPNYGNAPDDLVQRHKAIVQCMSRLYEIDPQTPELFALADIASSLEQHIRQFYPEEKIRRPQN